LAWYLFVHRKLYWKLWLLYQVQIIVVGSKNVTDNKVYEMSFQNDYRQVPIRNTQLRLTVWTSNLVHKSHYSKKIEVLSIENRIGETAVDRIIKNSIQWVRKTWGGSCGLKGSTLTQLRYVFFFFFYKMTRVRSATRSVRPTVRWLIRVCLRAFFFPGLWI